MNTLATRRNRITATAAVGAVLLTALGQGTALADNNNATSPSEASVTADRISAIVPSVASSTSERVAVHADGDTTTVDRGGVIAVGAAGADGVTITSGDGQQVGLTADVPDGATGNVVDGVTFFDMGDHSVAYQPVAEDEGGGVRTLFTLDDATAPHSFKVDFDLPDGARLLESEGGSVLALDADGQPIGAVPAPWAKDATGSSLPTHYTVNGTSLVQHVTTTKDTVFPVVADPFWIPAWAVAQIIRCGFGGALGYISSAGWNWWQRALAVVGGCLLGMR